MAASLTHLQVATSPRKQKFKVANTIDREWTEHNLHLQSDSFCFHIFTSDDSEKSGAVLPWTSGEPVAFGTAAVGNHVSLSNESRPVVWSQFRQLTNSTSEVTTRTV